MKLCTKICAMLSGCTLFFAYPASAVATHDFGEQTSVAQSATYLPITYPDHEDKIVYQSDSVLIIALDESVTCADNTNSADYSPALRSIGDPYPGNPQAKSCKETIYKKADVAKVVQRLGTTPTKLQQLGYTAAVGYLLGKITGPAGNAISTIFGIANALRVKSADWWSQALAKITLKKASYIKHTIYCNYGGGYPAAYSILTLH